MRTDDMTICAQCCGEIPMEESQICEFCGRDGLGNCCIGEFDHPCRSSIDNKVLKEGAE